MAGGLPIWKEALGWRRVSTGQQSHYVRNYMDYPPVGGDPNPSNLVKLQALHTTLNTWVGHADADLRDDPELNRKVHDLYEEAKAIHDQITRHD